MSLPDFKGVVVAAGRSTRFGGATPKPFQVLAGRTVLERSVRCLTAHPAVGGVVVVLAPSEIEGPCRETVASWNGVLAVVAGGATRSESVSNGVRAAAGADFLLVHDAARPLATPELVAAVVEATRKHGAAVPLLPIPDTVKELDDGWVAGTLDRGRLGLAQTPQGFRADWLRSALDRAHREGEAPTDEAAALEREGHRVRAVTGSPDNQKITTPRDLSEAERRIDAGEPALRVGTGFDVHRTDPERRLVLGGVTFEGEPGLAGHSDADVVLHAAMDALLGAAALGDIGALFPPDDDAFAGADSTGLARRVAALLDEHGFEIVNLDLTLLAESPKIRRRVDEMRGAIAECLSTTPARVGLKATTLEGLGALGRREGAACQAVAMIRARRR